MNARTILSLSGDDRIAFLQDLVTNDVTPRDRLIYAALLTPQGKYLADFFVLNRDDRTLIDADAGQADALAARLTMYRLRRKIGIDVTDMPVACGTGPAPEGALPDPRHPDLGWRLYGSDGEDGTDWDAVRVAHCIPQAGIELIPDDTYLLEAGFERLNGVDFRKGCYVGQEIVARMKHKTDLRKGLATVAVTGDAAPGTPIMAGDKPAGTLHTRSGDRAIAYLRFDRVTDDMRAGEAAVGDVRRF
ncbi:aminomethyl transferase family protein [Oceaniovalibus guishaninsula JLT2003]|uniref:Aminomethyl transferase family protein n=1 Tax=Oceaniovalibus guishaninsula JLT2003 TaxID=1231392 RepID=K2HBM4_9RHOB|nr:folate-binding protein YgfZ [Oceaniovalibus guishaninsula]EKE44017.1 aminomethyl transferase family protein [Oceaniovalibus guishaninsula JLT2003]